MAGQGRYILAVHGQVADGEQLDNVTGLGIQFLRHLQRTELLLHLVDIAPIDPDAEPADDVRAIAAELANYSAELAEKPRWLVINKIDLLDEDQRAAAKESLLAALEWNGPVLEVSAATGEGTESLAQAVMRELEEEEPVI